MDAAEQTYRATAREWLLANTEPLETDTGFATRFWMIDPAAEDAHHAKTGEFRRKLYAAGYIGITVPTEYGGQGGEGWMQRAFNEEAADRNIDMGFYNAIATMTVPAILAVGTEEQKRRYLPGLLSGEESWCQLFSEPGAGSDLAGLGCKAVRDGDEFIINGQKVWNSAATYADYGILLVRTDPSLPKHQGITFLLVDMHQEGVETRRLVQANGAGHFCEVFFTDARCPVSDVLGEIDGGWNPTRIVMSNESALIGGAKSDNALKLHELAQSVGADQDANVRQKLAEVYTRQLLLGRMSGAIADAARRRQPLPIDPSVVKLYVSENRRREGDLAHQILGAAGTAEGHEASAWAMELLHMRYPISIGGGTDEVHRNNVSERALGLPRDIRVDKDVAWTEIPKG